MLFRPYGYSDGGIMRPLLPGDVLGGGEALVPGNLATVGAGTWTGALIASGIINRTGPVAGYTDTTDTAASIVLALAGPSIPAVPAGYVPQWPSLSSGMPMIGTTLRLLVQNTVAFLLTWAAGVGVIAGNGTLNIAASTWREYLVTILNSTPQALVYGNTTNANAVVNGMTAAQTALLTPGMYLPVATGITAGTLIQSVQPGVGFTMNANATATNLAVAIVATSRVQFDALRNGTL